MRKRQPIEDDKDLRVAGYEAVIMKGRHRVRVVGSWEEQQYAQRRGQKVLNSRRYRDKGYSLLVQQAR